MNYLRNIRWLITAVGIMLYAVPAVASEDAKSLFKKANAQYSDGNYELALKYYVAAATIEKRASVLFNIAQCHRQLGHSQEALDFYRRYLEEWKKQNPNKEPPYQADVLNHIAALEKIVEANKVQVIPKAQEQTGATTAPVLETSQRVDLTSPSTPVSPSTMLVEQRTSDEIKTTDPFYKRWWFWTAVGVGAGAIATTIVLTTSGGTLDPVSGRDGRGTLVPSIDF